MDFTLIHTNQPGMIAIEAKFEGTAKLYIYKALESDNIRVSDKILVSVNDELKIVTVVRVINDPLTILEPERAYRWIVQKIDTFTHSEREYRQNQMIEQLRVWESQRRVLEAAEAQRKMLAGLPGMETSFERFRLLGSQAAEVHL